MKRVVGILTVLITFYSSSFSSEDTNSTTLDTNTTSYELEDTLSKEDKLLYLNIGTSLGVILYGIEHWGYSSDIDPHTKSEGWFGRGTESGGADKFGHAYTAYFSAHMFSYIYEMWGYEKEEAAYKGAWSSFLFTSIMEVGDSFSDYGLSYEDMVVNSLGALLGYYTFSSPALDEKLDFRVEYKVHKGMWDKDFMTDYEELKYLFALKASGFEYFKTKEYLSYLELYLGYYTRGFAYSVADKQKNLFIGIGIDLSKLFDFKAFEYYQVPKSYIYTKESL